MSRVAITEEQVREDPGKATALIAIMEGRLDRMERDEQAYRSGLEHARGLFLQLAQYSDNPDKRRWLELCARDMDRTLSGVDPRATLCSICRERHGPEIEHACE